MNPWDRLDNETDPAWQAFQTYRDMGLTRSLSKVEGTLHKSHALIGGWSSQHRWRDRVIAWDREQDRIWQAEVAQQRRLMAERQMATSRAVQGKIAQWVVDLDPRTLTPTEAARWYEVAVKTERAAVGEPDRLELSGDLDVQSMSQGEILAALADAQVRISEVLGSVDEPDPEGS